MTANAAATAASLTSDDSSLRELINSVLREELGKLGIATRQSTPSVARIVREKLCQEISPPDWHVQESHANYAAAMGQQPSKLPNALIRQPPPPLQSWTTSQPKFAPTRIRNTDLWHAADW